MVAMQRDWVADHGGDAVVEGRDIGTVVFPDAAVKVYPHRHPRRSGPGAGPATARPPEPTSTS